MNEWSVHAWSSETIRTMFGGRGSAAGAEAAKVATVRQVAKHRTDGFIKLVLDAWSVLGICDELVVFGMRADPKPDHVPFMLHGECPVV
jgi:hypothetical protein